MLAFHHHIGLSLALIALALGAAILIWAKTQASVGTSFAKLIGYIIIVLGITNILCAGFYALKYWSEGYMSTPNLTITMQNPMMEQMMQKGMMQFL